MWNTKGTYSKKMITKTVAVVHNHHCTQTNTKLKSSEIFLELWKTKTNALALVSSPNSFIDLLEFGIENDIPDAVRIGENLAGLQNEHISDDLEHRLKQYTLKNSKRLRDRMEFTGPMQSIIQRRKNQLLKESQKYTHSGNSWRLHSGFAPDYSKYGILGEIFGEEKLDEISRYVNNQ